MLTTPAKGQWASSHLSIDNLTSGWMAWQGQPTTSTVWGTANRAIYVPVRVPRTCLVRTLGYASNTTGAGNVDVGLYDAVGVQLVSTGSTAKSTSVGVHAIDVTDTTIGPGLYYIGLNNSTTTDTFYGLTDSAPLPAARGLLTEALASVTLPATATWAVDNALAWVPVVTALLVTEVT